MPGTVASLQVSRTQSSISGTILDVHSNPIVGAAISDATLGLTTSAPDGKYCFYNITATGSATLTVTQPNFSFPQSPTAVSIPTGNLSVNFIGVPVQTITFAPLSNLAYGTAPFTVSATASSGLAVSFNSQTPFICTVSGTTVTLLSIGMCTIQATQGGNVNWTPATPVNQSFQVTQAAQTITFGTLSDKALGTAPFTVAATSSSGLAVSFSSQTVAACTVSGTTVTLVAVGTCTIQATQGGNANYSAATPVSQSFQVVLRQYLVGDVFPFTTDSAPNFGDGALDIRDLVQVLFAVNNVPGFRPAACSDRFDAMDLYPVDVGSTRGGDGLLDIRDLIRELFRVNNLDTDRPVRTSRGGVCPGIANTAGGSPTAAMRSGDFSPRSSAAVQGALVLGNPERSGAAEERVPVYLEAGRDLVRVAVTFALGDQRSQLRFVTTPDTPPSLAQDSQLGVVAVAWLKGLTVRAGERLLLGYTSGPAGASANIRFFGMSASGLDDNREVRLAAPTAGRIDQ